MKSLLISIIIFISGNIFAQIPSYVPVYGLISYFPFNGNGNDANNNSNNLTNYGAVATTDRFNNANAAFNFNGSSQYFMNSTPNFIFNPNSTFTVSLWHNRNTSSVVGIPIMHGSNAGGNFIWIFQTGATNMQFGTNKQQSSWIWAQSTSTTNVWTHIVLVYNAGAMTLYKDNIVVATATFNHTNVTSTTLPLYIGRGVGSSSYFNGKIDDVGIWNRCLSPCEINDLFTASNTLTTVNAGPNLNSCNGGLITLNASGADSYIWNPNIPNGISFTPSINQTFTVTGFDANNCSAWDQTEVILEQFTIDAGNNATICQGDSILLNATGASNIIWNNNINNGTTFIPLNSGYILANATNQNGCIAIDSLYLTVNPLPNINAGADLYVCPGDSILLNASGSTSILWNGIISNDTIIYPNSSELYIASGQSNEGCTGSDTLQIFYGNLPDLDAGPDQTICNGESVTLTGSGGIFMYWNNGVADGVPFNPSSTGSYVLTGSSNDGCVTTDTVTVNVNTSSSATITATGIDSYTINGQTYTASGTYTQTIPNVVGCDSLLTINLTLDFTGIQEQDKTLFLLYPNPASQTLFIQSDPTLIGQELLILNTDGRLSGKKVIIDVNQLISIQDLPAGLYFIQIGETKQRFVISGNE